MPKNNKTIRDYIEGIFLFGLHYIIATGLAILGIFTNDWFTLLLVAGTLTVITFMNILLHNCPLSNMERSKLGTDMTSTFNKYLPIEYDEKRQYSVQMQYIIILLSIVNVKGILWLFKRNFKDFIKQLDNLTD